MYFSQTAEYALRAMVYLAALPEGDAIAGRQLSKHTEVPAHYLSKIMRLMVVADLVVSQRGHKGGFHLAKPAGQIRFIDILTAADYVPTKDRCAFGWGRCDVDNPCPLHDAWSGMATSFSAWARENTLADVQWSLERLDSLVAQRGSGTGGQSKPPELSPSSGET